MIGTQTLEQSLDIDADLLISDLCPGGKQPMGDSMESTAILRAWN